MKAKVGDTVRTNSGDEFVVLKEETDEAGIQYVWRCNCTPIEDCYYFSKCSYGVPNTNFQIIKS